MPPSKGLLTPIQRAFMARFAALPDAEPRDAVDLHFILREVALDELLAQAAEKDPGFDLYWYAVALNRAGDFPDQLERWPVRMVQPFEPRALKAQFRELALELMSRLTSDNPGA